MGNANPCPLPTRIPCPPPELIEGMYDIGFTFGRMKEPLRTCFTRFHMPVNWSFIDDSWRADLPEWFMVDREGMTRYTVTGSWKEAYDNNLVIRAVTGDVKFVKEHGEPQPSQTKIADINAKLIDAFVEGEMERRANRDSTPESMFDDDYDEPTEIEQEKKIDEENHGKNRITMNLVKDLGYILEAEAEMDALKGPGSEIQEGIEAN